MRINACIIRFHVKWVHVIFFFLRNVFPRYNLIWDGKKINTEKKIRNN